MLDEANSEIFGKAGIEWVDRATVDVVVGRQLASGDVRTSYLLWSEIGGRLSIVLLYTRLPLLLLIVVVVVGFRRLSLSRLWSAVMVSDADYFAVVDSTDVVVLSLSLVVVIELAFESPVVYDSADSPILMLYIPPTPE
jgi:hypothetical protein